MYIPRFRKINKVLKEIKEYDKDTELNWQIIKYFLEKGLITKMKLSNAWLINTDELYSLFWHNKGEK